MPHSRSDFRTTARFASTLLDAARYWFSIDHGGQGSVNSSHGVADSYSCGNWFLEVEAKAGHCGGGCHVNYFNQRLCKATSRLCRPDSLAAVNWRDDDVFIRVRSFDR